MGTRLLAILAASAAVTGCANTGLPDSPTLVAAREVVAQTQSPWREPPARSPGRIVAMPAQFNGNVWEAPYAPRSSWRINVDPVTATIVQLPPGEQIKAQVAGTPNDIGITSGYMDGAPFVAIKPNCAASTSQRYLLQDSIVPVDPAYTGPPPAEWPVCIADHADLKVVTDTDVYTFELQVTDGSGYDRVIIQRPLVTRPQGVPLIPRPAGTREALTVTPVGQYVPAWMPISVWADAEKLVVEFPGTIAVLPGLWAGLLAGDQAVEFHTVRTPAVVYLVTARRVTEGELRLGAEVAQFRSGRVVALEN